MKSLRSDPSKEEEIAYLDAFTASLPADSYLRLYFQDATVRNEFAWCIRNDFGPPDLSGVRRMVVETRVQEQKAQQDLRVIEEKVREAKQTLATIEYRIEESRSRVRAALTYADNLRGMERALAA